MSKTKKIENASVFATLVKCKTIASKVSVLRECISDLVASNEKIAFESDLILSDKVIMRDNRESTLAHDCERSDNFMIDSCVNNQKQQRLLEVWAKKACFHVVARMSEQDALDLVQMLDSESSCKRDIKKSNSKRQLIYINYDSIEQFIELYLQYFI